MQNLAPHPDQSFFLIGNKFLEEFTGRRRFCVISWRRKVRVFGSIYTIFQQTTL
jgi:hypothetical protein